MPPFQVILRDHARMTAS